MLSPTTVISFFLVLTSSLLYCIHAGYEKRKSVYLLRKQGTPTVEGWSWWTGHLLFLDAALKKLPSHANVLYAWHELFEKHPDSKVFLVDLWPIHAPFLLIWDAEASNQVVIKYNLAKPRGHAADFSPIVGGESMISMNHETWKPLRALFSPWFSGAHFTQLVPTVVESVEVFCELLRERAQAHY